MLDILKQINPFSNNKVENKFIYILKVLLSAFLVYFISLIVGEIIIIGGSYLFGYNATDKQMPYDIMLLCTFYGYIITILFFIIFSKKINKIKLKDIGLNKNFKTFFKGVLYGVISLIFIIIILLLCGAIKFNGLNKNINYIFLILYLFAYLIQSAMEEIVCRGYILHRLKSQIFIIYACIISILFFTITHFSKLFEYGFLLGIIGLTNLMLISIIFVILTLKDKNIYSAIGLHFIWNFALFSIIGLNLSGLEVTNSIFKFTAINSFLTGSSYGIESSIITTIVLIAILFIVKRNVKFK